MKNTFVKIALSLSLVLLATSLFANETGANQVMTQGTMMDWVYEYIVFILGGLIVLGAVLGIVRLNSQLLELQKIQLLKDHGIDAMEKLDLVSQESWFDRWVKNQTKIIPMDQEEDVMLDHEYDGIRELDNILPPWWVSMFNITIVIGVLYFGYFQLSDYGYTGVDEWEWEMAEAKVAKKAYLATQKNLVDENSVVLLEEESDIMQGKSVFTKNCTICHGVFGEGGIGPSFTDKYWIYGGDIKNIFTTIKYGTNNGMTSFKDVMGAADMQKVASYILSLQGTSPEGAKEPEGDLWEPVESLDEATESE